MAGAAHLSGPFAVEGGIVVANDFPALDIPLARGHHAGAGVLQHRNEEGEHVTLGVEVLHGAEGRAPLPFPAFGLGLIVAAVALPEGDVPAGKPPGPALVGPDEGRLGPRVGRPELRLGRPAVGRRRGHRQGGEVVFVGEDVPQGVGPVAGREQVQELFPEPFNVLRPPWIVPELLAEMEIQRRSPLGHLAHSQERVHGGPPVEAGPQGVVGSLELPGGLGRKGQAGEEEGGGEEELAHHFLCFVKMRIRMRTEQAARATKSARKSAGSPDR